MPRLPKALAAFNSPGFKDVLRREIEECGAGWLPLQQCLSSSSYALAGDVSVMIFGVSDDPDSIHAKMGIFFSGIIAGCNCSDDPTPVEPQNEYCELQLVIAKASAEASVTPVAD